MIENLYKLFLQNRIVTTDSRNITPGSIFFALKGENFDGNKFAKSALEAGASIAVIDNADYYSEGCIIVDDSLSSLQKLSNYHRRKLGLKIIGITGSNGKTTTKELLSAVLSMKYNVYATKGNLNNHIGVPLTLLSLTSQTEIAIVEMGANHPGDIKQLVEIAEPNFGLITNIGRAHLGGFGSFDGVINTKAELFDFITIHGDKVFFNQSNSIINELVSNRNLQNKSISYDSFCSEYRIKRQSGNPYLNVTVKLKETLLELQTKLVGDYNLENVIAAVTVGKYFDVSNEDLKIALQEYTPTNNRSQYVKTPTNTVIMDAYNANPSSMEAALRNFSMLETSSKMVIIGEMLELGDYSLVEHQKIVNLIIELGFENVFLIGNGFKKVSKHFNFFEDSTDAREYLSANSVNNFTILLKGSRGVRLEKLMDVL